MHLGKTELILARSKTKLKLESNLNITCKGTDIEPEESVKYLGATLEMCLSCVVWSNQLSKGLMLG